MATIKLPITKKQVTKKYLKEIDEILDYLESKTYFTPEECVSIVYDIIEKEFNNPKYKLNYLIKNQTKKPKTK